MEKVLLLFDIDGTLISNSNAGIRSCISAIEMCCNVHISSRGYMTDGKTDLVILRELMTIHGIDVDTVDINQLAQTYLSILNQNLVVDSGHVLPGVRELLEELSSDDKFMLGLATGNLEQGAKEKLTIHRLFNYFVVGGYGSDALDRPLLVAVGISKANEKLTGRIKKTILIGDTPLDINAAKKNNIPVLAVATGKYTVEELNIAGGDIVVHDLTDTKYIISSLEKLSV